MGHAVRRIEEAFSVESPEVAHDFATVLEVHEDGRIVYEGARGRGEAAIAAACLLEPRVGDRVLVVERGAEAYVLSVLSQSDDAPARLRVDRDLELRVAGRMKIVAREGLDLATEQALRLVSKALELRAKDGEVSVERLAVLGREAIVSTGAAKLVTGALESFVDRLTQHVKRSYRTVEEMEAVRAKRLDYRTEEELSLRGKHAFVHAADLVKVTGAQIHMG